MRLPVDITLHSKHILYNGFPAKNEVPIPEETMEKYNGTLSVTGDRIKLEFDSALLYNETKEKTVVMTERNTVLISRRGNYELNMVFCKENTCECIYLDAYRQMNIRIHTDKLENSINRFGGKLNIDYTVEILGSVAEENSLSFSVTPIDCAS